MRSKLLTSATMAVLGIGVIAACTTDDAVNGNGIFKQG